MNPKNIKCGWCKTTFPARFGQRSFENWCCPEHGFLLSKKKQERAAKAKQKEELAFIKHQREKLLTKRDWEKKLVSALHSLIRIVDDGLPCVCCGEAPGREDVMRGGLWDAGHYRSVGSTRELKFDPRNIHRQRKYCNSANGKGGNYAMYRKGLISRYGQEFVEWLDGPHEMPRMTIPEIREKIDFYKAAIADIKKNGEPARLKWRVELRKLP